MESLALFFSASGRLAPRPFAAGVAVVYLAAFSSQLLLSPPVLLRAGFAPFILVQALSIWAWFCLHAKRLRDAGRDIGPAVAIVVLYAMAMILFLLVVALLGPLGEAVETPGEGSAGTLIVFDLFGMLRGDLGLFAYVAAGIFALIFAPMLIALAFSVWAAARPTALSGDGLPRT